METASFQFDYLGYLRNMVFLIILLGVLAFILIKLKNRDGGSASLPRLSFFTNPMSQAVSEGRIEVIERKVLEPRKTLYLVRIFDDQYWLIGTTDTSIEALGQVQPPGYLKADEANKPFSDYLDKA
jgi:flagellar biogenesis protein FliO